MLQQNAVGADLLNSRVGFVSRPRGEGVYRKAEVANDEDGKTTFRALSKHVRVVCGSVRWLCSCRRQPSSNDRPRSKWKIDTDKPILSAEAFSVAADENLGNSQCFSGSEAAQCSGRILGVELRDSKRIAAISGSRRRV